MNHKIRNLIIAAACLASLESGAQQGPLSSTLTLGYDSRYVLYGYRLSRHLYRADLYLYYPLDEKISVWGGGWYGYLTDGTYHEVDVYGGIDRALTGSLSAGLAYSLFNYLEVPFTTANYAQEFAAHLTWASGPFSLSLRNQYDTEAEGSLLRGIAKFDRPIAGKLSARLIAEGGYAFEYYIDGNLWNHALARIETPYQGTDSIAVTPFVARSVPLAAIDDFEQYETLYGVSGSITF